MGAVRQLYNSIFRRSSTFLLSILVGAVVFERVYDEGMDTLWARMNRGQLWDHIKDNYVKDSEE